MCSAVQTSDYMLYHPSYVLPDSNSQRTILLCVRTGVSKVCGRSQKSVYDCTIISGDCLHESAPRGDCDQCNFQQQSHNTHDGFKAADTTVLHSRRSPTSNVLLRHVRPQSYINTNVHARKAGSFFQLRTSSASICVAPADTKILLHCRKLVPIVVLSAHAQIPL